MKYEFPRLVYKSADTHMLVKNEDELEAAIDDGWYFSVPDAINKVDYEELAEIKRAEIKAEIEAIDAKQAARAATKVQTLTTAAIAALATTPAAPLETAQVAALGAATAPTWGAPKK